LQYSIIKHHNHNKYVCYEMKNLLNTSKGKNHSGSTKSRNHYHEEDSKYRYKNLQKFLCKSKTPYDNKLPACLWTSQSFLSAFSHRPSGRLFLWTNVVYGVVWNKSRTKLQMVESFKLFRKTSFGVNNGEWRILLEWF